MSIKSSNDRGHVLLCIWACLTGFLLTLAGCKDEPVQRDYPKVRTLEVTNITDNGATFVAEVIQEGTVPVTEHGFTWSLSSPDAISDERVFLGSFSGTGVYEAVIKTALKEGLTYEVCAFVRAGEYTVYGESVRFLSLGSGAPEIIDFMPKSAGWGDTVTIFGRQFSHINSSNEVFAEDQVCIVIFSSDTLLRFVVPPSVTKPLNTLSVSILGNVTAAVNDLTLIPPEIFGFTPESGFWGDTITFTGSYLGFFGQHPSDGMILNDNLLCPVVARDGNSISFIIPGQLNTVSSPVSLSYRTFRFAFPNSFTLVPPVADHLSLSAGTWGTLITLYGKFNFLAGQNKVFFGDKAAEIILSSVDSLVVKVPATLAASESEVTYKSGPFNIKFADKFLLKGPEIYSFEPKSGFAGNLITINGRYFNKDITTVEIGDKPALVASANDTVIIFHVPGDVYGVCTVAVKSLGQTVVSGDLFNATNHVITDINPLHVDYGSVVTVTGSNLRPEMVLYLGQIPVTPVSLTDSEIRFVVPTWLNYDPWSVAVKCEYWHSPYTITSSFIYEDQIQLNDFTITGVTPLSGEAGDLITITGTNFGNVFVSFGTAGAELAESSMTSITVRVPALSAGEQSISVSSGGRTHVYSQPYTHSGPWRRLGDLPFLYEYACVFDFGEEAYVVTAGETGTYEKEIYRFNPSISGFDRLPGTYLSTVLDPSSCTLDGKGYMIGQRSTYYTGIGFEVFDPVTLAWSMLPDYPGTGIVNPCIIADDSVLYVGCGKVADPSYFGWYRDFWKYSPATNSWTQLANCPYDVSFSNHIFIDGRILFAGFVGTTGPRFLLEYMPLTNTWNQEEITDENLGYSGLWDFKNGAKVSVINNGKWYLGFGDWYQVNFDRAYDNTNPDVNNRFYTFDPTDNRWETISNVAVPARTFPLAFSYGGKIYIGGSQIYHYYDFWEYDPLLDQ